MSVGRVCVREVDLASPSESVWTAAERMHQRAVGSLVVLDNDQRPLGILTDRDIVERVVATNRDPQTTTVDEVMTRPARTVSEENSIESALSLMQTTRCRRLIVVDAPGKLVGLVSVDDILMLLAEELRSIGKLLERETPRGVAG